jgi:hypothetical protein
MGVDWFNCTLCNEVLNDHQEYWHGCERCGTAVCMDCVERRLSAALLHEWRALKPEAFCGVDDDDDADAAAEQEPAPKRRRPRGSEWMRVDTLDECPMCTRDPSLAVPTYRELQQTRLLARYAGIDERRAALLLRRHGDGAPMLAAVREAAAAAATSEL